MILINLYKCDTLRIDVFNPKNNFVFIFLGYKMNSEPKTTDEKILFYHRYIEALKFANELKTNISDPNFSSDEVSISKSYRFAPALLHKE